ncbi:hypothetical protein SVAN01_10086 [Stagonosporopsis vannaccii]|nr:hypothetical protein SVAN01_10086 [Stagonosporopsis vannaccii]
MPTLNDHRYKDVELQRVPMPKILQSLPDHIISRHFSDLYEATVAYVRKFYTPAPVHGGGASQMMIEQASSGVLLPWPEILDLLSDSNTRLGTLVMCIGRVMLSRSLLLKLGTSNSLGATLLPPEVVECFQSFCMGRSALTMDGNEPKPLNLSLLARWKQISATLLHDVYVDDAFSPFDARTINIERAMEDLGPLLNTYAIPQDAGFEPGSRVSELRLLIRNGAQFAFVLFSQPCLWSLDWYHNREIEAAEGQLQPEKVHAKSGAARRESLKFSLPVAEVVVWPSLLRVVDHNGCRIDGKNGGVRCGSKKYLAQVLS